MFELRSTDNFSKTIKVGRIASVSDLRTNTTNGRQCVEFTIAINKPDEKPDYYNCIAYNGVARNMDRYIRVGHKVLLIGTESIILKKGHNGMQYKSIHVDADFVFLYESETTVTILTVIQQLLSFCKGAM